MERMTAVPRKLPFRGHRVDRQIWVDNSRCKSPVTQATAHLSDRSRVGQGTGATHRQNSVCRCKGGFPAHVTGERYFDCASLPAVPTYKRKVCRPISGRRSRPTSAIHCSPIRSPAKQFGRLPNRPTSPPPTARQMPRNAAIRSVSPP